DELPVIIAETEIAGWHPAGNRSPWPGRRGGVAGSGRRWRPAIPRGWIATDYLDLHKDTGGQLFIPLGRLVGRSQRRDLSRRRKIPLGGLRLGSRCPSISGLRFGRARLRGRRGHLRGHCFVVGPRRLRRGPRRLRHPDADRLLLCPATVAHRWLPRQIRDEIGEFVKVISKVIVRASATSARLPRWGIRQTLSHSGRPEHGAGLRGYNR